MRHHRSIQSAALVAVFAFFPAAAFAQNGGIFWSADAPDIIEGASLDGTGAGTLVDMNADVGSASYNLRDITNDGHSLYWVDSVGDVIYRSDLDGSNPTVHMNAYSEVGYQPSRQIYGVATDKNWLYWTDRGQDAIYRTEIDGTGTTKIVNLDVAFGANDYDAYGIATDGTYVYWAEDRTDSIYRAGIDGSNPTQLIDLHSAFNSTSNFQPHGITTNGSSIYWTDFTRDGIYRANIDGTGSEKLNINNFYTQLSFDVVTVGSSLYWSDRQRDAVYQANLDGSDFFELIDTPSGDTGWLTATLPGIDLATGLNIGGSVAGGSGVAGGVDVEFEDVTEEGLFTVEYFEPQTFGELVDLLQAPGDAINFTLPLDPLQFWDIEFDGVFDEFITLTLGYEDGSLDLAEELALIPYHYDKGLGEWVGVYPVGHPLHTEGHDLLAHDTTANTFTFQVNSLSPFVLGLAVVPEPSTIVLGLIGGGALIGCGWRRSRRSSR